MARPRRRPCLVGRQPQWLLHGAARPGCEPRDAAVLSGASKRQGARRSLAGGVSAWFSVLLRARRSDGASAGGAAQELALADSTFDIVGAADAIMQLAVLRLRHQPHDLEHARDGAGRQAVRQAHVLAELEAVI